MYSYKVQTNDDIIGFCEPCGFKGTLLNFLFYQAGLKVGKPIVEGPNARKGSLRLWGGGWQAARRCPKVGLLDQWLSEFDPASAALGHVLILYIPYPRQWNQRFSGWSLVLWVLTSPPGESDAP